jgi:chromosome segregation ATPase
MSGRIGELQRVLAGVEGDRDHLAADVKDKDAQLAVLRDVAKRSNDERAVALGERDALRGQLATAGQEIETLRLTSEELESALEGGRSECRNREAEVKELRDVLTAASEGRDLISEYRESLRRNRHLGEESKRVREEREAERERRLAAEQESRKAREEAQEASERAAAARREGKAKDEEIKKLEIEVGRRRDEHAWRMYLVERANSLRNGERDAAGRMIAPPNDVLLEWFLHRRGRREEWNKAVRPAMVLLYLRLGKNGWTIIEKIFGAPSRASVVRWRNEYEVHYHLREQAEPGHALGHEPDD